MVAVAFKLQLDSQVCVGSLMGDNTLRFWKKSRTQIIAMPGILKDQLRYDVSTFSDHPDFSALDSYYDDITNHRFDAEKYFAEYVKQYITLTHLTPSEIDQSYQSDSREYKNQQFSYDKDGFELLSTSNGITYYSFLLNFKCFQTSRQMFNNSEIRVEVGFNEEGKIFSMKHTKIEFQGYSNQDD